MSQPSDPPLHPNLPGRGAAANPYNRFERLRAIEDLEFAEHQQRERESGDPPGPGPATRYYDDPSRSILAHNDSPDVPFDVSINPYRGCEHGCIYCYARPGHEYLGLSAGLDFETKIFVKQRAPELLRAALAAPRWRPQTLAIGGVTDAYQPVERHLKITRRCLEVLAEFRNPTTIVTKSSLVRRDADLLAELAQHGAAAVYVSVTTLDPQLHRVLEPRTAAPSQRLATIKALAEAGIPVGVMVAPIIPALNDHEVPNIVAAAAEAGAGSGAHILLRLPHALAGLFEDWLERHFPERRQKVMNRVRATRAGRINDPRFGSRMRGEGFYAEQTAQIFELACRRAGFAKERPALSPAAFRRPPGPQLGLFDVGG
jgi:DNA repair photolyase